MGKTNKKSRSVGNGEGSLYYSEKLKLWVYQYYYNGKRKTIKQRKNELVKDFKARARDIKMKLDRGSYIEDIPITIYELGKRIIDNKFKRNIISEVTFVRNNETLNIIKKHEIANTLIQRATSEEIQEFVDTLQTYANSTITKVFSMLKAIFLEAIKYNYIIKSPMLKVEKPKSIKQDKKIKALTIEEQQAFLKQLQKETVYKDIFIIAIYTGMRMGEILGLKVDDIDFKNKEIHLQRTLTIDINGRPKLGLKTKTYAGNRTIPITPLFENELKNAIKNRTLNINNLIFTYPDGQLYSVSNLNFRFKRICTNAGIGIKPYKITRFDREKERTINSKTSSYNQHMLRHTYATRCIEAGMPAEVLQHLLGHRDISTTINTYTTIFNKFKKEQINKYVDYINNFK